MRGSVTMSQIRGEHEHNTDHSQIDAQTLRRNNGGREDLIGKLSAAAEG